MKRLCAAFTLLIDRRSATARPVAAVEGRIQGPADRVDDLVKRADVVRLAPTARSAARSACSKTCRPPQAPTRAVLRHQPHRRGLGRTGLFTPADPLSGWPRSGSGVSFATGLVMSQGLVMSESGGRTRTFATTSVLRGEP